MADGARHPRPSGRAAPAGGGAPRPLVLCPAVRRRTPMVAPGPAPRVDFAELAAALGGPVLYPPADRGRLGRLEDFTGLSLRPALAAAARDAPVVVSLAEGVALPLALTARVPHVAVVHNATRRRTRAMQRLTGLLGRIDRIAVLARAQERFLVDDLGVSAERVRFVHDKVDERFWSPRGAACDGTVLSVGAEGRDYGTLTAAVAPLGTPAVVVAGSLWVRAGAERAAGAPANVAVRSGLAFDELRDAYDRAAVVVVPLAGGLRYAAGVNAVLEAMAMGKALVVSGTPGIADYVEEGVTARVVPPGDAARLRAVVAELLGDPGQRAALGASARRFAASACSLDRYVASLAALADEAMSAARGGQAGRPRRAGAGWRASPRAAS